MKGSRIAGLGSFVPENVRRNSDWPADFVGRATGAYGSELAEVGADQGDPCDAIVARHLALEAGDVFRGSRERRVADASMSSAEAEAIAGRRALSDAGVSPDEVDLVLSWSMVPDRVTPSSAPRVAHLVGARNAGGVGIDVACGSGLAQMLLAASAVESGRARYALLTQSHLIARANPMAHPASPIVGDAATAFVIGPSEARQIVDVHMVSHGEYHAAVTWARGRDERESPWWEAGAEFTPGTRDRAQAKALSKRLVHLARDTVNELLARTGRAPADIDVLALTQPRRWFPAAVAEAVGVDPARAPSTWDDLAHVGGCGPFINLIEARRRGMVREGSTVAFFAMGAGITRAAALVTM